MFALFVWIMLCIIAYLGAACALGRYLKGD